MKQESQKSRHSDRINHLHISAASMYFFCIFDLYPTFKSHAYDRSIYIFPPTSFFQADNRTAKIRTFRRNSKVASKLSIHPEYLKMSKSFTLSCIHCHQSLAQGKFEYICPDCKSRQTPHTPPLGVLKTTYPYSQIRDTYKPDQLFKQLKKNSYTDILPIGKAESLGPLKVGETPIYTFELEDSGSEPFMFHLKDDSQNPTFSFKDRASQLICAYAREQEIDTIVVASTGNAGSSLAGMCASQKQRAIIIVPKAAPAAKLIQIMMYGALPVMIDGNYDKAFELSVEATRYFGWFNRNTAYNPFTIEGKKTVAFEIFDQLKGRLPSRIFVPVGDGVILAGLYKGFEDLLLLGIIKRIPVIVAVQSENSSNLVRNMGGEIFSMQPSTTLADGISIDYPRNFYMAKSYLETYKGEWLTVSDKEIMEASFRLASETGIFTEPASAAAMAGMLKYIHNRTFTLDNPMMVLTTGSGLKDIQTPMKHLRIPEPIQPNIEALKDYIRRDE
jgi:threonine synthase